jgi:PadR family transcriptional regulator PadR
MSSSKASMRAPTYFVLAALLDEPLHGYAIIKRVGELSADQVRLAAGTLYATLDRLADTGLVEVVREETVNGRARRYYALTGAGAEAVREEAARLAEAARIVPDGVARRATVTGRVSPA